MPPLLVLQKNPKEPNDSFPEAVTKAVMAEPQISNAGMTN